MILHQSSEQGVIDKEETEMLRDVFRFSDKRANELMTYRPILSCYIPHTHVMRYYTLSANNISANICW